MREKKHQTKETREKKIEKEGENEWMNEKKRVTKWMSWKHDKSERNIGCARDNVVDKHTHTLKDRTDNVCIDYFLLRL